MGALVEAVTGEEVSSRRRDRNGRKDVTQRRKEVPLVAIW
jgi:hypothetical protein